MQHARIVYFYELVSKAKLYLELYEEQMESILWIYPKSI